MKSMMKFSPLLAALFLCAAAGLASAQTAAAPQGKQALVQRVLSLWHIENEAMQMVQRPAVDAVEQSRIALQGRVSAAKQEATLKDIAVDVQKYLNEATPIVRDNALRLKEPTLAPLLAQNFSEDELRQLIALLESPVKKKFESLVPQMEKSFGEKVAAESRAGVDPKLQEMTKNVGLKLRAASMTP